mgnify:CR=1 FL=1
MLTASGLFFFAQELVPTGASLTPVTTWNQFLGSLREMETVRSSRIHGVRLGFRRISEWPELRHPKLDVIA